MIDGLIRAYQKKNPKYIKIPKYPTGAIRGRQRVFFTVLQWGFVMRIAKLLEFTSLWVPSDNLTGCY
jgi:hypothetical protein